MSSLAARPLRVATVLLLLAGSARAQSPLSHLDDAAPVPAGALRLRIANVWTRYDERFAAVGEPTPLGGELSADSLGVAQLPRLFPIETGLRTLATDPALKLSFGQLRVGSNARVVTTPITLEYGVTRRLSIGVQVPIVETRRVAMAQVSGDSTHANVSFLLSATQRTAAAAANLAVVTAYQRAADSLGVLLAQCPGNPAASGCAAVNANSADATAARARAQAYADAVRALGTTSATTFVAPRKSSDLADTLDARRLQLNARLQQYLGAGAGASSSVFLASNDFSYRDLQGDRATGELGLLGGPIGGGLDSIHTTEHLSFGDIAVGARFLVFDRFHHDTTPVPRLQTRLVVGGAVRFATSLPDSAQSLVDIGTGDGAGIEAHSAFDLIFGHFGTTLALRYAKFFGRTVQAPLFGDPEAAYPYPLFGPRKRTPGDVLGLDFTPRLLITETLALAGHYGMEYVGVTRYDPGDLSLIDPCPTCLAVVSPPGSVDVGSRTAQRLGFGFRYSTVDAWSRGRAPYPIEVSFARLQTLSGYAGLPKQSRDQIEVRLYYQVMGRR